RQSSESISAASAREPTPAIVYENTTSSGVSTSIVCESEPWDRVRSTGRGPEGAVMNGELTQRQAGGKQRTMGPSYLGWIDRQMDEERCEFSCNEFLAPKCAFAMNTALGRRVALGAVSCCWSASRMAMTKRGSCGWQ